MEFTVNNENGGNVQIHNYREENGVFYYDIDIDFGRKIQPKPVSIKWHEPRKNVFSVWGSNHRYGNGLPVEWSGFGYNSRLANGAPVISLIGTNDKNAETIALSDPYTPIRLAAGVREEDINIVYTLELFVEKIGVTDSYHATLRFDRRDMYFYEAIEDVRKWWDTLGFESCYVPDTARMPMYSTWYSFHQKLDTESLTEQCKMAKKLGMEAIIIDDGWQTDDNNRGYAYCGDWEVTKNKIPDMRYLVDEIHKIGMKVIVWFSVPYVGKYTKAFEQFKDMYLNYDEEREWCDLDPRFAKVREFLINIYVSRVKEWGIDGFKLDFIDSMFLRDNSRTDYERMDYISLEEATERLMKDVTGALREINPEICIEFRQCYMGPIMKTFGNMIRVGDCPNDALANRIGTIDLRMLCGKTPVHSDMIKWHKDEITHVAALQFLNIMFSVPQISVKIETLSDEHYKMLEFYLDYWIKNREILLDGKLRAKGIENNYTFTSSENDKKVIAVSYGDKVIHSDGRDIDFFNASGGEKLYIDGLTGKVSYEIYDCMGKKTEEGIVENSILYGFSVPQSGLLKVRK